MKGDVGSEPYRLSETHDMFTSLTRILVKSATDLENRYWIPLMEQAVNVMYKLAESPDIICGDLIKKLAKECSQTGDNCEEKENKDGDEEDGNPLDGMYLPSLRIIIRSVDHEFDGEIFYEKFTFITNISII